MWNKKKIAKITSKMISQREADKIAFENDLTGGKYFDLLIKYLNSKIFVLCEFPRNISDDECTEKF